MSAQVSRVLYLPIDRVQGLAVSHPGRQFVEEGTNDLTATQRYGVAVVTRGLKHISGPTT